jgi:hypothetical protein
VHGKDHLLFLNNFDCRCLLHEMLFTENLSIIFDLHFFIAIYFI